MLKKNAFKYRSDLSIISEEKLLFLFTAKRQKLFQKASYCKAFFVAAVSVVAVVVETLENYRYWQG